MSLNKKRVGCGVEMELNNGSDGKLPITDGCIYNQFSLSHQQGVYKTE